MKQLTNTILLITVMLLMFSCNEVKEVQNEPINVQFGFTNLTPPSNTRSTDKTPVAIIISIKQSSSLIHTNLELAVHDFNGVILTEPLPLLTGSYEITEFKVKNAANAVIYATPIDGSPAAKLVNDGLGISFDVSDDNTGTIAPQVLDTENFTATDFGYPPFGFEIIPTFHFLISAKHYNTTSSGYIMTEANVQVTSGGHIDFDKGIDDSTASLFVRDIDTAKYVITVSKPGFNTWVDTLTNAELKTHDCVETGEIPVNVILTFANAPIIAITSPSTGFTTSDSVIAVSWSIDGVEQATKLSEDLTVGENIIVRSFQNSSGITGSASITVTRNVVAIHLVKVVGGGGRSFFLKNDNTLWGTGYNASGELGDGTNTNRNAPVEIMSGVIDVSSGGSHTLILKSDNTLWATGYNGAGQLGDGNYSGTGINIPKQIMTGVSDVSAGGNYTLILKSDNTLWATGYNGNGQLGDGTIERTHTPKQIMSEVSAVSTGFYHSLILKNDNTLWVTGRNENGQLGNGGNSDINTPVQIMSDVIDVSGGGYHSLILKSDNTLWAAGSNEHGQIGDGTNSDINTFKQIMTEVIDMNAGGGHSLILKSDKTLWATGYNPHGQLGDGTNIDVNTPKLIMSEVIDVSGSGNGYHSLIIKSDSTLWVTGANGFGQLGDGTNTGVNTFKQLIL